MRIKSGFWVNVKVGRTNICPTNYIPLFTSQPVPKIPIFESGRERAMTVCQEFLAF